MLTPSYCKTLKIIDVFYLENCKNAGSLFLGSAIFFMETKVAEGDFCKRETHIALLWVV